MEISQGERLFAVGILLQWFWSSVTLTGDETMLIERNAPLMFWSSVTLIGVLSALIYPHHAKTFLSGLLPHDPAGYERV